MKRRTSATLVAFSVLLLAIAAFVPLGNAQVGGIPKGALFLQEATHAAVKIAPGVLADTADGESTSVVILLSDQADVSAANDMKDQDARGWYVLTTLTQHALRTQRMLRRLSDEDTVRIEVRTVQILRDLEHHVALGKSRLML